MNAPLERSPDGAAREVDDLYAQEMRRLLRTDVLPRRRWGRALDAGCGSGELDLLLAAACDEVVAIDQDLDAVRRAAELIGGAGARNVVVRRAALGELDPAQRFDLIAAVDVLEGQDDAAALDALARLLAPGGTLFLTARSGPGEPRGYTREQLFARLSTRFRVERCAYFGASLVPLAFVLPRALQSGRPAMADVGLGARVLRRVLRAEATRSDLPCGTALVSVSRSREDPGAPPEPRPKWPKIIPLESAERRAQSDAFMERWHELLPERFGLLERFNHGHPARSAPAGFRRTLELGAGRGEHLDRERLTPEQRRGYHMLELRDGMCRIIRERHPDAIVIQGDCQRRLDFPDGHFDRVLAIHVLEHLPDLPAAVREAWRLCDKARGVLHVVIPCEGGLAYGLARRVSAQRVYESAFGVSYLHHIEREHINEPREVLEELAPYFEVVEREFFPLQVPSVHLNLVIGLTLRPRATPLREPR